MTPRLSKPGARTDGGAVPPTTAFVLSLCVIAAGAAVYALQSPTPPAAHPAAQASTSAPAPSPSASPSASSIDRSSVYVVIFNNTTVATAGKEMATTAESIGWDVVGVGSWKGLVDTTTVYYPPKLQEAANLLAADLGITSVKPAFAPMQGDRLSVIITKNPGA